MRYSGKRDQDVFAVPEADGAAPDVLDAGYVQAESEEPAPSSDQAREQAFIPSERVRAGDAEARLELRPTEDGSLALLCYESLDLLIAACGDQQPWVSVYSEQVGEVRQHTGADVVLWNAELPAEVRKDEGETR